MSEGHEPTRSTSVVVIIADTARRTAVEEACRAAGLSVLAVGRVAEMEQWPEGHIVVTDAAHLTPWWRQVGAAEVIVLVQQGEDGFHAAERGATQWLQPPPTPDVTAAMVRALMQNTHLIQKVPANTPDSGGGAREGQVGSRWT